VLFEPYEILTLLLEAELSCASAEFEILLGLGVAESVESVSLEIKS
jgi:hypothetical protein